MKADGSDATSPLMWSRWAMAFCRYKRVARSTPHYCGLTINPGPTSCTEPICFSRRSRLPSPLPACTQGETDWCDGRVPRSPCDRLRARGLVPDGFSRLLRGRRRTVFVLGNELAGGKLTDGWLMDARIETEIECLQGLVRLQAATSEATTQLLEISPFHLIGEQHLQELAEAPLSPSWPGRCVSPVSR